MMKASNPPLDAVGRSSASENSPKAKRKQVTIVFHKFSGGVLVSCHVCEDPWDWYIYLHFP